MPRRIIIHAGFHKTGTSTLQLTLRENRAALKKYVALRLRWHMREVIAAARGYSTGNDPLTLIKVQSRFARMVNDLPGMPRRTLIISCEELGGHLPGRGDLDSYAAMPVLLYSYWEIVRARYPEAEILIYLSTRGADDWLVSAHWEHVKSSNMTLDLDAFRARYGEAARLDDMADEIASRVPVKVHKQPLEETRGLRLGPADPMLDLCDIPADIRATLTPVAPANRRLGDDVLAALLEINRTAATPEARKAAKEAVLAQATSA